MFSNPTIPHAASMLVWRVSLFDTYLIDSLAYPAWRIPPPRAFLARWQWPMNSDVPHTRLPTGAPNPFDRQIVVLHDMVKEKGI